MKFEKYESKKLYMGYKYSQNMKLLDDFKASGLKCAKVTGWTCKCVRYCASSIQHTIKKHRNEYKNIICICRRGEVFLINEAVNE